MRDCGSAPASACAAGCGYANPAAVAVMRPRCRSKLLYTTCKSVPDGCQDVSSICEVYHFLSAGVCDAQAGRRDRDGIEHHAMLAGT